MVAKMSGQKLTSHDVLSSRLYARFFALLREKTVIYPNLTNAGMHLDD